MEYVEGRTLREVMSTRAAPLTPTPAADIVVRGRRGPRGRAPAGLVHRDVKPANIMVDDRGR